MIYENWVDTYGEPAIEELLEEPIVAALMQTDGVEPQWLRGLLERAQLELPA